MGLLKHALFWPVTGPKAILDFSLRQVDNVVRRELTDDERIHQDLMALQMELEVEAIDEEEFVHREAVIMERLREARMWREQLGMEEAWSPLEFTGPEPEGREDAPVEPSNRRP